jgi:L-threonylcarbamoyladenylate synthase
MTVRIETIEAGQPAAGTLDLAARQLRKGGVIACATDTGYAFAADALDARAIARVFHLKGRSFNNPIHIAVGSIDEADKYAVVNEEARYLAEKYLPGGLTLVLARRENVPAMLVAGMATVGIRIPDNRTVLELVARTGFPLTMTSANVSGRPGTYSVPEIRAQLGEAVNDLALVLDEGPVKRHEVSTIVDLTVRPATLIRQGLISWLELREDLKRFPPEPEPAEEENEETEQ